MIAACGVAPARYAVSGDDRFLLGILAPKRNSYSTVELSKYLEHST
jgi:hypothetical protein